MSLSNDFMPLLLQGVDDRRPSANEAIPGEELIFFPFLPLHPPLSPSYLSIPLSFLHSFSSPFLNFLLSFLSLCVCVCVYISLLKQCFCTSDMLFNLCIIVMKWLLIWYLCEPDSCHCLFCACVTVCVCPPCACISSSCFVYIYLLFCGVGIGVIVL